MTLIKKTKLSIFVLLYFFIFINGCESSIRSKTDLQVNKGKNIITGAENLTAYLPLLKDKNVGVLVNHTSTIGDRHLVDTLLSNGISISKIFSPEHGFRGDVSDGLKIENSKDTKTGIPIISLYGRNKKPTSNHLSELDIIIYDIQDVGVRFYTYISAMHYMMEACANNNVQLIILDRPNPNGHYIDGPVLDLKLKSYIGMHPIPIVYGMTPGELAQMIVKEKWINTSNTLNLKIIPIKNWNHQKKYDLPIKPSPNLPNTQAIALYPSLCLFEGTKVSVGRGTYDAFQVIGTPDSTNGIYTFTPLSIPGMSKYPPYENQKCYGLDLKNVPVKNEIDLSYLIDFYNKSQNKNEFFNTYFNKLAGTELLRQQIENGLSEAEIKVSWKEELDAFKKKRNKYLLYKDFD